MMRLIDQADDFLMRISALTRRDVCNAAVLDCRSKVRPT
jgi:hypothetical protein